MQKCKSVIDMDGKKIIVINGAIEKYYDSYKLGYEPIKYGRIRQPNPYHTYHMSHIKAQNMIDMTSIIATAL